MTDQVKQANLEKAQLLNANKFVAKFIEVVAGHSIRLAEQGINVETDENRRLQYEKIEASIREMIERYPGKQKALAHDFAFLTEMLRRLGFTLVLLAVEDIAENFEKQDRQQEISDSLNDMLGFTNSPRNKYNA